MEHKFLFYLVPESIQGRRAQHRLYKGRCVFRSRVIQCKRGKAISVELFELNLKIQSYNSVNFRSYQVISRTNSSQLFLPISACFSQFQPIPAQSTLFQPIPAYSSIFQTISAHSSQFQPSPAYSSLFQPIPAYFSIFQPIPAYSSLFQHSSAYSS